MASIMNAAPASTAAATRTDSPVIKGLDKVLAASYALLALTHEAHWNVEGPGFFSLHKAFQEQYEHLFQAIDEIAERSRALGGYPRGSLKQFAAAAGIDDFSGLPSAKDYVAGLIVAHEKTAAESLAVREAAGAANDLETQDLMIRRLQWHQKTLWMLKSYLK